MTLSRHVESYRFWEVVTQWARERLEHEHIVARVLAKGVLREGLRVQRVDPRWANLGSFELRGTPIVGYVARQGDLPIFIRTKALAHLTSVVERAASPEPDFLRDEFISKQDFHALADSLPHPAAVVLVRDAGQHQDVQRMSSPPVRRADKLLPQASGSDEEGK
ncbi:MAG: hypothetical protein HYX47_04355 [Burkholderiales bacterium]|nr:hypothetical protein [Burkholderiales bacterium]